MDYLVILFAKLIGYLAAMLGGGTNLPGQIALKLRPNFLKRLVRGYRVILVTGTNGKTTTTAMLQNILQKTGKRAVFSASGANMKGGVVSCLVRHFPIFGKTDGDYAVLEVDEAYMRHITAEISPEVIAVTNVFPDQLDRYGEVDSTLALIEEACKKAPNATLVLNADEPRLGCFLPDAKHFYYGFATGIIAGADAKNPDGTYCPLCHTPLLYNALTFSHLGSYVCTHCGSKRPQLHLSVNEILDISPEYSDVVIGDMAVTIPQAGAYNIYNALCAAACAKVLGVSDTSIIEGLKTQKSKFGRQETIIIGDTTLRMILVKNPAGAEEALSSVLPDKNDVRIGILLNDNVGDGKDVSWIYDVSFEKLQTMRVTKMIAGGTRAYDMAVRLKVAGFEDVTVCKDYETLLATLQNETGRVYLFVTYSAMTGFRKFLHGKKYIKKLWI